MKQTKLWIFGWLMVVLGVVNYAIYQKEEHLAHGTTVCLPLAPVDPRSLMQGDYMALRFALENPLRTALSDTEKSSARLTPLLNRDGRIVLDVDANCTATFDRLYHGQKLRPNQQILHYRIRHGKVTIASNAFFFQEGTADRYAQARYGIFKVQHSDPLLVDLADAHLTPLSPKSPR